MTSLGVVLLIAGLGHAQSRDQGGHRDIIGQSVNAGARELENRGYRFVDSVIRDDRGVTEVSSWFWNGTSQECLSAIARNGRYTRVEPTDASYCKQGSGVGGDRTQSTRNQQGYADLVGRQAQNVDAGLRDRGYRLVETLEAQDDKDEPVTLTYWWHAGNKECVAGISKNGRYTSLKNSEAFNCKQQDDSSREPSEPGSNAPADVVDLVGGRASSGEQELQSRGYKQVDFDQKNQVANFAWWYNEQNRQCIRVTIKNGLYKNITSDQNRNCK